MKISAWAILLVGFCVAAVALSYSYFKIYSPNQVDIANHVVRADQLQAVIALRPKAEQRVRQAQEVVAQRENRWNQIVATKTAPPRLSQGGINLAVNAYQLPMDVRTYRDNLQLLINRRMLIGGVTVVGTGPEVPMIPQEARAILSGFFNYPAIPFPVVILDLGTITVQGTYDQIIRHVKAWKDLPNYLAVTTGLNFTGTSPILTARYQVSLVGYIKGDVVYPVPPGGGSAAPAPAGGGGPAPARRGGGRMGAG